MSTTASQMPSRLSSASGWALAFQPLKLPATATLPTPPITGW
jgi:hypothetical protein